MKDQIEVKDTSSLSLPLQIHQYQRKLMMEGILKPDEPKSK